MLVRGDAPWTALTDLSPSEWESWCANREVHGYNAAIVSLVGATIGGGNADGSTFDGVAPFVGGDITNPNGAYWSRMDAMVAAAEAHGITLLLYVMDGWNTTAGNVFAGKSTADCETYGAFVANRYTTRANILWMVGGDYAPVTNDPATGSDVDHQFDACLTGIRSTGDTRPFSIQLNYDQSWSTQNPYWEDRVDWNFVYSYPVQYDPVWRAYQHTPALPALFGEGHYEDERDGTDPIVIRKQAAWAVTSGSAGDIAGSADWDFETAGWQDRLDTATVTGLEHVRDTFAGVAWWALSPSLSFVTSGAGTRLDTSSTQDNSVWPSTNDYATAAVAADGSLAVVYLPTRRGIPVDTSQLGGNPAGVWVDAATGATTPQADVSSTMTPPATGDWLLTITADPA